MLTCPPAPILYRMQPSGTSSRRRMRSSWSSSRAFCSAASFRFLTLSPVSTFACTRLRSASLSFASCALALLLSWNTSATIGFNGGLVTLGSARLLAGANEFAFEVVGRDPASVGYLVGIDDLELELDGGD